MCPGEDEEREPRTLRREDGDRVPSRRSPARERPLCPALLASNLMLVLGPEKEGPETRTKHKNNPVPQAPWADKRPRNREGEAELQAVRMLGLPSTQSHQDLVRPPPHPQDGGDSCRPTWEGLNQPFAVARRGGQGMGQSGRASREGGTVGHSHSREGLKCDCA